MGVNRRSIGFVVFALVAAGLVISPNKASGASVDVPCDVPALNLAVAAANANEETDTLALDPGCEYFLTSTLTIANNELLTIEGNGATLDGAGLRAVDVLANALASLDGLTIVNSAADDGAGIRNNGTTTVTRTYMAFNVASGNGGAIFNDGDLTLVNSTLIANESGDNGAATYNNTGTLTMTNVTIYENEAPGGFAVAGGGTTTVKNSIVGKTSPGSNCSNVVSGGNNIQHLGSVLGTCPAGFVDTDPQFTVGALAGGPTAVIVIADTSPAKGAANPSGAPSTDARGATRDGTPDIGAYEIAPFTFEPTRTDDPEVLGCLPLRCSLREAVVGANAATGPDIISLDAATYQLSRPDVLDENGAFDGDLDLTSGSVDIVGKGRSVTAIDGGAVDRVLHVLSGASADISQLTVQNGQRTAISPPDAFGPLDFGGGIRNDGDLNLDRATVSGNTNLGTSGDIASSGGGIYNNGGSLSLSRTIVIANQAPAPGGGAGIYSDGGTITIDRSTIDSNSAQNYGGFFFNGSTTTITRSTVSRNSTGVTGAGGGAFAGGTTDLTNVTFSLNTAQSGALAGGFFVNNSGTWNNVTITQNTRGGVYQQGITATVTNTIVADNPLGAECTNGTISGVAGNNLEENATCFTAGDLQNTPVLGLLGPLQDNGGPTETHAIASGTPAHEAGASCAAEDQRGVTRPQGTSCDVGAYELATDTTAPTVTIDTGPSGPTKFFPVFTFSSTDLTATFECSLDTGTPSFDACSGANSHTPAYDLADGPYTFRVKATDPSGNAAETLSNFTLDRVAPTAPTISLSAPSGPSNDNQPEINGTTDAGTTVELVNGSCGGLVLGSGNATTFNGAGVTATVASDVTTNIFVRATDAAGNLSCGLTGHPYNEDSTAPSVAINTGPAAASTITTNTATFTYSSPEDPNIDYLCSTTGVGGLVPCDSNTSHTTDALADGPVTFTLAGDDAAGNRTTVTRSFNVDTTAPSIVITSAPKKKTTRTTARFVYAIEAGATFTCKLDGKTVACGPTSYTKRKLKPKRHTFVITATDAFGNTGIVSYSWKIKPPA